MYEQLEIPFEEFQHETKADILMKKTKKELVEIIQNQETMIEDLKMEVSIARELKF